MAMVAKRMAAARLALGGLLLALSNGAALGDCPAAQTLDTRAGGLEGAARVAAYRDIVAQCAVFNYQYKLGRALQDVGDQAGAMAAFEAARPLVGDGRSEGLLYGRLAQTYLALDRAGEAAVAADAAWELVKQDVPPWLAQVRQSADTALAAKSITAADILADLAATRAFKVAPRVRLYVLFRSLRDSLTDAGEAQVAELGRALAALPATARVKLVGHTDGGADDFAALRLSTMRAERVMEAVLAAHPEMAGRLSFAGKGGQEPRHQGDDEALRKLNRRVEVVLESE